MLKSIDLLWLLVAGQKRPWVRGGREDERKRWKDVHIHTHTHTHTRGMMKRRRRSSVERLENQGNLPLGSGKPPLSQPNPSQCFTQLSERSNLHGRGSKEARDQSQRGRKGDRS
ncbi:hypothetical protein LX32DRAFT_108113 [Colletotrichum zoysiae]|uniref:Uncharacterized protein n=1 Tax=Colletotrichum zoysiae TaxID=1216348 RepID=A0AAD9H8U3_9PEZI|nr:hypothetical protein LX32DRAFT_108113 [Colletotrichum zoysiae]